MEQIARLVWELLARKCLTGLIWAVFWAFFWPFKAFFVKIGHNKGLIAYGTSRVISLDEIPGVA